MRTRLVSAALVLAGIVTSQAAFALPSSSEHPYRLQPAIGQYSQVQLDPSLETALDGNLADILAPKPGDPPQISKGAVVMVARHGKIVYHKAQGLRDGNTHLGGDPSAPMTKDAIFDLESMTKPFTAAVIMRLSELGVLDIDDLVIDYLPDFEMVPSASAGGGLVSDPNKAAVTVRDMLRYTSGLDLDALANLYGDSDPYLTMSHEASVSEPGTAVLYSDLTYRLLGHVAEKAYADAHPSDPRTLAELVGMYITGPLGMVDTHYEPAITAPADLGRVAGTGNFFRYGILDNVPGGYRRGEVQDDQDFWTERNNALFPGQAPTGTGCDGLFSTAMDLGRFAQMLLNRGRFVAGQTNPAGFCAGSSACSVVEILSPESVEGLTTIQTLDSDGDRLGDQAPVDWTWDLLTSDKAFGFELMLQRDHSVGGHFLSGYSKTGGAGTFLIVDPEDDLFIVVLTNHGLPDIADFFAAYDGMLEEIGPYRVADSVAAALEDPAE